MHPQRAGASPDKQAGVCTCVWGTHWQCWCLTRLRTQGVTQEQLERALPHLAVDIIARCINQLSMKVRGQQANAHFAWRCWSTDKPPLRAQNKIQIFQNGPLGSADATPVFRAVKPEDEIKCVLLEVGEAVALCTPLTPEPPRLQVEGAQPRRAQRVPAHPERQQQGRVTPPALACGLFLTRVSLCAGIWTKDLKAQSSLQQPQVRGMRGHRAPGASALTLIAIHLLLRSTSA